MRIVRQSGWVHYVGDGSIFDPEKVGKWMYFFGDKEYVAKICKDAVKNNIVAESKHSDADDGVACCLHKLRRYSQPHKGSSYILWKII